MKRQADHSMRKLRWITSWKRHSLWSWLPRKKWLVPLILTTLLLLLITLERESVRSLLQQSETEPVYRVPVAEATTGAMLMRLALVVAGLATEVEEVAEEAVVTAMEAAGAVEAEETTTVQIGRAHV